jgi:MFS family permease
MADDNYSALSSKNYRTYLFGSTLSVLGVWVQRLALGWHAWELTGSALIVGLLASAQFLPLILLTPFFGVLVDQVSARHAAVLMNVLLAATAATLGVLTVTDNITVEWLLTLAFLHGIANSAYSPVRHTLIPDLVSKQKVPSAVAINAVVFNVSRLVGPAIAGAVVAWYGIGAAYFINALSYIPAVIVLSIIRVAEHEPHPSTGEPYLAQLAEGLTYTRDHAPIRQIILLAGVSNFFGRGIMELMPAFSALIFGGGSGALAALMAAAGVGAILSSLMFSSRTFTAHLHEIVVVGGIGVGISLVLFGFVSSLPLGMLVVALMGLFGSLVSIGSQTEVQIHVENRLRGRVMSLWTITIVGGPAVGSVVAGALAGPLGATQTSLGFAAACLVLILVVGLKRPNPQDESA